ncbi:hypothetical protein [Thiothrix nivea]|uniref:Uncharacterized protein n=1 Tax=Thiothrix nivea (strain ATCC 35100 / DSM 5205 / JP2) TaxID=870187 RepID=A0A656HIX7_THINJ|nr:hypothetical protein [Thiothrix nivea]EIJ35350.1 hypothetical protein Thini_2813 [Thiothrix nivea DSM 5205]
MLQVLVILATILTWIVTQNMMYAAIVLVVGWIGASVLGRIMTWAFYLLIAAGIILYGYAYLTGQSFMKLLWQLL